jgi:hypothetical protein
VNNIVEGISSVLCIFFTLFIVFGLPFVHILMLLKRKLLNRGVANKFKIQPPKPKKLNILEQAEE